MNIQSQKDNSPKPLVTFKCLSCSVTFQCTPVRVENEPNRIHPFRYFANCAQCQAEVQQVNWEVGSFCSIMKSTGPTSLTGKAASAANLAGHPTVEERALTRFNALTHGTSAKTALFFPAKPGKYAQCATCDIDYAYCQIQPACIKRTELLMQHLIAFESGDPSKLTELNAINQARIQAMYSEMLQTVANDGVTLTNPIHSFANDGSFHLGKYEDPDTGEDITLYETKAHPLLKDIANFLGKNNMNLAALNMTPKVQTDQDIQMGHIAKESDEKQSLIEYQQKMAGQLSGVKEMLERSKERTKRDSILIEHQRDDS